jgi:hypothetical protein
MQLEGDPEQNEPTPVPPPPVRIRKRGYTSRAPVTRNIKARNLVQKHKFQYVTYQMAVARLRDAEQQALASLITEEQAHVNASRSAF